MSGRQSLGFSRRTMLAVIGGGAGWVAAGCSDDENPDTAVADAAPDANLGADAGGADSAVDAAPDGAIDTAAVDAGAPADVADGAAADASVDEGAADAAADARPPGILSVPEDDPDVTTQELTYPSATSVRAYLAAPSWPGSFAGLVLIPDERGLGPHIRDVARRFAKSGCVALVPDLASRAGGTVALGAGVTAYLTGAKLDDLLADLKAAVDALAKQAVVGANRYGVCGLGWGGDLALRFAAVDARLRAAVVYYAVTPTPPEIMKATNAAILGQYGSRDPAVNATVPALERVMMEAGKTFTKDLYDAGHGFNDDTAAGYDEPAAVAAWAATIQWFDPHLQP